MALKMHHTAAIAEVYVTKAVFRIAQAWQRLEQGQGTEADILLLRHEFYELTIMREHGYSYDVAHPIANKKHPWHDEQVKTEGGK